MNQDFGAYLQCHKNPLATYKCLESFRSFYPNSTIVLLSDNGYDYTTMAEHFNCIYIHEYENVWLTCWNIDDLSHNVQNSYKLINRMNKVFSCIKEEYVMWLEDDVSINGKIQDVFNYDLNGFSPNRFLDFQIDELYKKYTFLNKNNIYLFNGHGGSVFYKNTFLHYLKNQEIIDDILYNWKNYKLPTSLGQDYFFSLIITLNKGTIGSYLGHADCSGYKNDAIIVQHQYKVWYNIEMPTELQKYVCV